MKLSLIITALDIREHLLDRSASEEVLAWCQKRNIECVYIETYRSKYEVPKDVLARLRDAFREADIEAGGCICTTHIGKQSTGWPDMSCLTDRAAEDYAEKLFKNAAELFDTVIIDNRLFADCCCDACDKTRGDRRWTDFHRDQTTRLLKDHVIAPALQANANVKLIFKFPSWYEGIASRGFDLRGQSGLFSAVFGEFMVQERAGYPPAEQILDSVLQERDKLESIESRVRVSGMTGMAAFCPPEGDARGEPYFFDYLGTLGFPLVPTASFPMDASAAAFCSTGNAAQVLMKRALCGPAV